MTIVAIVILILAILAVWIGYSCNYDGLFNTGLGVIVVEVVIGICAFVYWAPAKYACSRKADMLGVEYRFDLIGGCFIKDGDRWYEYNQQRIIR